MLCRNRRVEASRLPVKRKNIEEPKISRHKTTALPVQSVIRRCNKWQYLLRNSISRSKYAGSWPYLQRGYSPMEKEDPRANSLQAGGSFVALERGLLKHKEVTLDIPIFPILHFPMFLILDITIFLICPICPTFPIFPIFPIFPLFPILDILMFPMLDSRIFLILDIPLLPTVDIRIPPILHIHRQLRMNMNRSKVQWLRRAAPKGAEGPREFGATAT